MQKKKLIEKLNEFYNNFDVMMEEHTIDTFAKVFRKEVNELGDFIQELEDESGDSEKDDN